MLPQLLRLPLLLLLPTSPLNHLSLLFRFRPLLVLLSLRLIEYRILSIALPLAHFLPSFFPTLTVTSFQTVDAWLVFTLWRFIRTLLPSQRLPLKQPVCKPLLLTTNFFAMVRPSGQ